MKKRVIIIGASGFIGKGICDYLSKKDFDLVAVSRSCPDSQIPGVKYEVIGDFMRYTAWDELLKGCFAVIMAAGLAHDSKGKIAWETIKKHNVELPEKIGKMAVEQNVSKFIFFSSVKIFGEKTQPNQVFCNNSEAVPTDSYAMSKLQAEEKLRKLEAKETEIAIIRLPLVIGKNAKGNIGVIQRLISKGIPMPVAGLNFNSRSVVLINEIGEFISKIIIAKSDTNGTHLIRHKNNVSTKGLVQLVGSLESRKPIMFYIPTILLRALMKIFRLTSIEIQLFNNFEIDDSQGDRKR